MTADGGSAGNRDGFERWVASLQRPPGTATRQSEPDITSALVDESATHVQQIPKELIHRLRERETQGLLGVEVERTAVFKPPPELLQRAKRLQQPVSPSDVPPAQKSDAPTAPPPEAAVPTVRPPPPTKVDSFDDGWAELVEPGLDALKPMTARPTPSARPSRPVAPAVFSSAAPRAAAFSSAAPRAASGAPRPAPSAVPRARAAQPSAAPVSNGTFSAPSDAPASNRMFPAPSDAPASNRQPTSADSAAPKSSPASSGSPVSSRAPGSRPGPAVVVGRTVAIGKSADVGPPPAAREPVAPLADALDEPTLLRPEGFGAMLGAPGSSPVAAAPASSPSAAAPSPDAEHERTAPRVSRIVSHDHPSFDGSLSGEAGENRASGRRWVVIAVVFLALVVLALAALKR